MLYSDYSKLHCKYKVYLFLLVLSCMFVCVVSETGANFRAREKKKINHYYLDLITCYVAAKKKRFINIICVRIHLYQGNVLLTGPENLGNCM